jgi:TolA-binding protein
MRGLKKSWSGLIAGLAILICLLLAYNLTVLNEQRQTIRKQEQSIHELRTELEYQNNVDHTLRENYANVQSQLDWNELYMWQYGTDRLTKAELADKVEKNPGITGNLLQIKKHTLPWQ